MDCAQETIYNCLVYTEFMNILDHSFNKTSPRQTLQNNTIKKNIISNAGLEPHQFSGQKYYGTVYHGHIYLIRSTLIELN